MSNYMLIHKNQGRLILVLSIVVLIFVLITTKEVDRLREENEDLKRELYLINDENCVL